MTLELCPPLFGFIKLSFDGCSLGNPRQTGVWASLGALTGTSSAKSASKIHQQQNLGPFVREGPEVMMSIGADCLVGEGDASYASLWAKEGEEYSWEVC